MRGRPLLYVFAATLWMAWLAGCMKTGGGSGGPKGSAGPGDAFVYTANAGDNTISAFANDSTGALALVPGSSFSSPGGPTSIAATPDHKFLYVSSSQTNLVNGFSINNTTGAITPLSCPGFANTGAQPLKLAITPSGTFLYTVDQGGPSVTAFSIDPTTGCLTFLQTLTTDLTPRWIAIEHTGAFLYVVTGSNGIDAFSIAANGTLTRQPASGFNNGSTTMVTATASPTAGLLLVSDAGNTNGVRVFAINPVNGALTQVTNSPFPAVGTGPSGIAFDPTGKFAFVANTGSNTVTSFSVAADGTLAQVPGSPVNAATGPVDLAVDPNGKFLYVAENGSNDVGMFSINAGVLTTLGTIATGSGPESIVVVPHP